MPLPILLGVRHSKFLGKLQFPDSPAQLTPKSFKSSTNTFDVNCGPRSEMILSGKPNLLYRFSSNNLAVPSAVIVLSHGMRITPLVRPWSTTTRIESKPSTGGKSVIRSIEQLANGRVVFAPSVG